MLVNLGTFTQLMLLMVDTKSTIFEYKPYNMLSDVMASEPEQQWAYADEDITFLIIYVDLHLSSG